MTLCEIFHRYYSFADDFLFQLNNLEDLQKNITKKWKVHPFIFLSTLI